MDARRFAMVLGVVFVLIAVLAFVPGINQMDHTDDPSLAVGGPGHGYLLGLFHVNVLHNVVHLLFGVMGIAMARSASSAVLYARIVAVAYGLLAVMGLVPGLNTLFGLVPIHGADVLLHLLIAAAAAYFGFMHRTDLTGASTSTTHA
jgi:Domain of unknown function (DUF4383)